MRYAVSMKPRITFLSQLSQQEHVLVSVSNSLLSPKAPAQHVNGEHERLS